MGPRFFRLMICVLNLEWFCSFMVLWCEWASQILTTDLVQSATLFRKAAGIYHYLGHEILPTLNKKPKGIFYLDFKQVRSGFSTLMAHFLSFSIFFSETCE